MANETTFALVEGDLGYDYALLAEEIISARYAYDNVRDLARTKDIGSFPSDSARFPLYPALSAAALTDGTDLTTNTAFNPTNATFAVSEVGLKLILTDLANTGSFLGDSDLATEAGKAVLEKINTDLVALGSGFSTVVGGTGVNLTELNVEDALVTLIGNKTPDDVVAILHERQWFDLINDIGTSISPAGTTGGTARGETNDLTIAGKGGMGGVLYGVEFRVNPLVPTANAGADRAGAMFIRNRAIALVIKWFIRPEFERDASYRGTETVVTAAYATGEIEDASGVAIITDA
jgi:hypothetical protein